MQTIRKKKLSEPEKIGRVQQSIKMGGRRGSCWRSLLQEGQKQVWMKRKDPSVAGVGIHRKAGWKREVELGWEALDAKWKGLDLFRSAVGNY